MSGHPGGAPPRGRGGQRGSVSIEAAIVLGTVIVTFFSLMIVAGRIMDQQNKVRAAAHAAARAATLHDDYGEAVADAETVALANLADSGIVCVDQDVRVAGADFAPDGFITIEVSCTAGLLPLLGMDERRYAYQATEVIDRYRGAP
jgi:uncharacterized membrane protein